MVSDNDGSAFITKAEFDSLKNNFQSQIDQYNTSIDSKIDGAIASYLAGVKVSKDTQYKVEIADWKEVLATNYVLPEDWKIPSFNLTFNYEYSSTNNQGNWYEVWWGTAALVYNKPSTVHQVRNLISAGIESTTGSLPDKVVWIGQSCDYQDKITGVKAGECESIWGRSGADTYIYRYLYGATTPNANMSVITALQLEPGYVKNKAVNDVWKAQLYWWNVTASQCYPLEPTVESDWINRDLSTSVSLGYVGEKQYKNEHIINYDNYVYTHLSDPTWTNTLGPNPSWTEDDALNNSSVSKNGRWGVFEINDANHMGDDPSTWQAAKTNYSAGTTLAQIVGYQPTGRAFSEYYSGSYEGTRTNSIMSVGVLDKTYNSEDIYQWKDEKKISRDETKSLKEINLYNGALIGYAKHEETFKWEPEITGSYWDTATSTWKPITKWRVKLSKKPFGIKDIVPSASDVLKNKDQTEDYLVTNDSGKCKYNIEITDDTVIFCKWWPDDSDICDNYAWNGTLDLVECGTYTITAT